MAQDKQRPPVTNYAGPGAVVGVQAGNITIGGGITVSADGVVIDGPVTTGDSDDCEDEL